MFDDNEFGMIIRNLRKSRNLTQLRVSTDLGISETHYSQIERGTRVPTIDVAVAIANLYGITFDEWVTYGENASSCNNKIFKLLHTIDAINAKSIYKFFCDISDVEIEYMKEAGRYCNDA